MATVLADPAVPALRPRWRRWAVTGYWALLATALLTVRYESFELYQPDGTPLGWGKHINWFVWEAPHTDMHGRPEGPIAVHRYALVGLYRFSYVGPRALFPG